MKNLAVFTMISIAALSISGASQAQAEGCKLNGIKLDCGSGNDASILSSLASGETTTALGNPIEEIDNFSKPSDLEVFRKSIEATWRRVNRAERSKRREMLRRQISAAEFETWSSNYEAARENYDAALTLYRNLVWAGKTGKAAPEG